jgi:hypothetical protein
MPVLALNCTQYLTTAIATKSLLYEAKKKKIEKSWGIGKRKRKVKTNSNSNCTPD